MKLKWLLLATLPLGGCMTSGTNMHGDFACRAPNGTCAPMSAIDAEAIAGMGGSVQPIGGSEIRTVPRGGRVVEASTGSVPSRTSDRVLQIVFPAHIDNSGIYHDAATAHAVVEPAGWTESLTGRPSVPVSTAAATNSAHAGSVLATLDEVIAARGAQAIAPKHDPAPLAPPPAVVEGVTAASWSRDPSALNLREAAAGANGGTVPDLDGANFDTPDVIAAVSQTPPASNAAARAAPRFKTVRWHGHKVRVPIKGQTPASASATPQMQSVRALNLASFDRSSSVAAAPAGNVAGDRGSADKGPRPAVAAVGYSTQQVVSPSVTPMAGAAPVSAAAVQGTPVAALPEGIAVAPPVTRSAAIAAARVRAMAAPVIAGGVTSGRAQAAAEATPDANPFTALVAAGNGPTSEPRP